mmetsp:Transcript_86567/g.225879  ORF Transcript_86567/g.225879 Transcript_86567/m.225879 type:complete len:524 (-) Transcript_86567:463-2034(-)
MATAFEPKCTPRTFAFIFPMASGHVNPSLPLARALVQKGHAVHYLSFDQFREAVVDTGATWHSTVEYLTEMFGISAQVDVMKVFGDLLHELGLEFKMVNLSCVRNILLERKMPGTVRFLRDLSPDGVVYCPLSCPEAMLAAKVVGIPSASLNTIAGPGALATTLQAILTEEGLSIDAFQRWVDSMEPDAAAVGRLNERYGLGLKSGLPMPFGKDNGVRFAAVNLVTTTEDLQDPVAPELARAYEADGSRFAFVGPLLDAAGARRVAGHRSAAGAEGEELPAGDAGATSAEVLAEVREARAAGRGVVLASMGTVLTGDVPGLGWNARAKGPDGLECGLTGRELCQAAWGGLFRALGAPRGGEGPLLVVSLGPQAAPLGVLAAPPNAVCAPAVPQVDVLRAGVDLFLTHGGQNSFTEALAHGTPVVVCPGFGDQIVNAGKAVDLGVGLKVDRPFPPAGGEAAAAAQYTAEVSEKLLEVWRSPARRAAAGGCAERLRRAGGVPRAARLVEEMAARPAERQAAACGA